MSFYDRSVREVFRDLRRWLRGHRAAPTFRTVRSRKDSVHRAAEILEQRICLFQNGYGSWSDFVFHNGLPIHEEITREGLSFLKENILDQVVGNRFDGNIGVDVSGDFFDEEKHFDGCLFAEGAANINSLYQVALDKANPDDFESEDLAKLFGQILHPAQDFYAC